MELSLGRIRALIPTFIACFVALLTCGCNNNRGFHFIETGYIFEHVNGYTPDRSFSKDTLSFSDYQEIVSKYTRRFGQPLYSGERDDAMRNYQFDDYPEQLHRVWGYATDGKHYTIYQRESTYLLILFSNHCGVFIFQE